MDFQNLSYKRHKDKEYSDSKSATLPSCYTKPKSIDAWRHRRMQETLFPLFKFESKSTWMTIGDGNFASDAYFLQTQGLNVLATSLNDNSLSIAHDKGYIDKYKAENAENISFPQDSFDFVLCKEAYHHFPRPAIAFYEMLRVCRKAIVLIEPQESSGKILDFLKNGFKKWIRKDKVSQFEVSGNFIFKANIREIEKMMTALNYRVVVSKKFSDFYFPRFSESEANKWSFPFLVTKFGCLFQDLLGYLKLGEYGLACIVAFKEDPSENLLSEFKRNNFHISILPKNPYL